jgi:cell division protein FtsA
MSKIIAGLDLGTTKIACIIANVSEMGEIDIIGVGVSPSTGLRRGVVVNIEKTRNSIRDAINRAEKMAGVKIKEVYTGIAGDHIRSQNSRGVVAVSSPTKEITKQDVERVIEQARAVSIPMDREIIHAIPQKFIVDDQHGVDDPVGISGIRLEANVHIVTGAVTSAQNIYKSIEKAGVHVRDLVLQPIASSYAVLDKEEEELGTALVDVGGGTTDVAIFHNGSIRESFCIGLGGINITNDIAIGIRTPRAFAEKIKKEYGVAKEELVGDNETIKVPGVGGRPEREIKRRILSAIIEPRLEEIFTLVYRGIRKTDYIDLISGGIVLTGGTAKMNGIEDLAESIFGLPVRIGLPSGIGGLTDTVKDPIHSTGVGLVLYGYENRDKKGIISEGESLFSKILEKMKKWFVE